MGITKPDKGKEVIFGQKLYDNAIQKMILDIKIQKAQ